MEDSTASARRVLVLCRDAANVRAIEEAVEPWMFRTAVCASLQEWRDLADGKDFAVAFCDDCFEGGTYRDFLAMMPRPRKLPVVVLISESNQYEASRDAVALGAFDVIPNPCSKQDVQWVVIRALKQGPAPQIRAIPLHSRP